MHSVLYPQFEVETFPLERTFNSEKTVLRLDGKLMQLGNPTDYVPCWSKERTLRSAVVKWTLLDKDSHALYWPRYIQTDGKLPVNTHLNTEASVCWQSCFFSSLLLYCTPQCFSYPWQFWKGLKRLHCQIKCIHSFHKVNTAGSLAVGRVCVTFTRLISACIVLSHRTGLHDIKCKYPTQF